MEGREQTSIENVARQVGEDWTVAQPDMISALKKALQSAGEWANKEGRKIVLNEAALYALHQKDPYKARAFIQALASSASGGMIVMVWKMLEGAEIETLELTYEDRSKFHMRICLTLGNEREHYETDDINDAALIRHLGILKINDQPRFEGFYPLHLK